MCYVKNSAYATRNHKNQRNGGGHDAGRPRMDDLVGNCRPARRVRVRCTQDYQSIYKNKEVDEFDTIKHVRQPDGISFDAYNLEVVMAVSFRIQSKGSRTFRRYAMKRVYSGNKECTVPPVYLIVHGEVLNRKERDKEEMYN